MSITCPKCGCLNRSGTKTCALCGVKLMELSFEELFGPPKQLKGRYTIRRTINQTLGDSLYEATDRQDSKRVCHIQEITTTLQDPLDRQDMEERFLIDMAAWQALNHPNIARVIDAFAYNSRLYLVTEAVEDTSLQDIVRDRRQKPTETALLHWAGQLAGILDYLHSQTPPMLLGYLSPASIRIDPAGDVKLVDFGLARYLQPRFSSSGMQRGVPGYEAPEQRRGELLAQSDIYSLGIILFAVATHHDPTERPLPVLRNLAPHLSETATKVIARAYRRDPAKRFATASAMQEAVLALGQPAVLKIELPPFALIEGQEASTLRQLVRLCATHWDDGLRALVTGRIAAWLKDATQKLRASGQLTEAEEIEAALRRTTQANEKMRQKAGPPGMAEIAHHAAFAGWLEEMGAVGIRPRLEVQPPGFDFGQIPPNKKAIAPIQIRNAGQGYLTGHVESPFPWLAVPQPIFGCRGGESITIDVIARGRRLPSGRTSSPQAILVNSNGGQTWLEARAESAEPVLAVETALLDFGPITRNSSYITHLTVSNQGGGLLAGRVKSHQPWLRVRRPAFRCPAGASARIAIELLGGQMPQEASDANRARRALVVDSDSGQAAVNIAWSWARPSLALDMVTLDFGAAKRAVRIERNVTLSNPGTADLIGQASSLVDWLTVHPAEFICPPGKRLTLLVTGDTTKLPGGDTLASAAIKIDANAGQQDLSASIEILAPELVIEPHDLDLETVQDGDDIEATITVGNQGSMTWEGQARSNVSWLSIEPQTLLCEPGHFVPLTAVLDTAALESGGEWSAPEAIQITGHGQEHKIGMSLLLARPQLDIARSSLDFGIIGRKDVATLPLEISNTGTGELQWRLEWPTTGQEAWLEASPASGRCGPGETAIVQITAYALAVADNSGQAWLTVHSNAGRADLPASVALSAPRLVVQPLALDFGTSENYAPLTKTLRISNRGVGKLQGKIKSHVAWLLCKTETFICDTGASTQIEIQAQPDNLRAGNYDASGALEIESNSGNETIDARLEVLLVPRLHISSQSLRFATDQPPIQQVKLENRGYGALRLRVKPSVDWIKINRAEWTIKSGRKAHLEINVNLDKASLGERGAIEIRSPEEMTRLDILIAE